MFSEYKKIDVKYEELNDFIIETKPIYLTVLIDEIPFEFLINAKENTEKAIVFGSGAFNSDKMSPPIFNRHKWRDDFGNTTTIYYNDPTLYLGKLNLAWGYGNKDRHFLEDIANILDVLLRKLSILNENVLFLGSSGGGFQSMMLAGMLKGSKAFVNNPQTIITNYYVKFVRQLYETIYPGASIKGFPKFVPERANVTELFKKKKHVPEIYYAQNLAVKHDTEKHMMPFIDGLNKLNGSIIKNKINMHLYYNKEQGHKPISKEETIEIINELLNN